MRDYSHLNLTPIKNISFVELETWIQNEIFSLADDFGNKLDKEQAVHIGRRLKEILSNRYKNWDAGEIHSVFQNGMSGVYGKSTKVTLQILLMWLNSADKQKRGENVNNLFEFEEKPLTEEEKRMYDESFKRCFPFIRFCEDRDIDISNTSSEEYYELRDFFNDNGIQRTEQRMVDFPRYNSNYSIRNIIRK